MNVFISGRKQIDERKTNRATHTCHSTNSTQKKNERRKLLIEEKEKTSSVDQEEIGKEKKRTTGLVYMSEEKEIVQELPNVMKNLFDRRRRKRKSLTTHAHSLALFLVHV